MLNFDLWLFISQWLDLPSAISLIETSTALKNLKTYPGFWTFPKLERIFLQACRFGKAKPIQAYLNHPAASQRLANQGFHCLVSHHEDPGLLSLPFPLERMSIATLVKDILLSGATPGALAYFACYHPSTKFHTAFYRQALDLVLAWRVKGKLGWEWVEGFAMKDLQDFIDNMERGLVERRQEATFSSTALKEIRHLPLSMTKAGVGAPLLITLTHLFLTIFARDLEEDPSLFFVHHWFMAAKAKSGNHRGMAAVADRLMSLPWYKKATPECLVLLKSHHKGVKVGGRKDD